MTNFSHTPVLLNEILALVEDVDPKLVVDCTLGGAGHSRAILERCPETQLLGLDRDPDACDAAAKNLESYGERVKIEQARFSALKDVLQGLGHDGADIILADLGVSSYQLDQAERGFAFRFNGPLDMRMNPESGQSAADLIAELSEDELAQAIRQFGEERYARPVARSLKRENPETTEDLARIVRSIVPQGKSKVDAATRTFQGLRIKVNEEIAELEALLEAIPEVLKPGGLILIIAYHSLEDRPVKQALRQYAKGCICPPAIPGCVCGLQPVLKLISRKPIRPSENEINENPRARSAKLRVGMRLGD